MSSYLYFGKCAFILFGLNPMLKTHFIEQRLVCVSRRHDQNRKFFAWAIDQGKLIQANVADKITWPGLLRSGLVPGEELTVDGMKFLCRAPIVEYDKLLYDAHPWNKSYWTYDQKTPREALELSAGDNPFAVTVYGPEKNHVRLILEPLCPDLSCFEGLTARLLGPTGVLTAKILEVGAYDLVCTNTKWLTGVSSSDWCQWFGKRLYIMRDAVLNAGFV